LLLRASDFLRFVGDGRNGTTGLLTYRAWDQSSGTPGGRADTTTNGGTTAFSSATDTATLTVASVNDAPVLTPAAPALVAITEDAVANAGQTVASFLGASSADVDNGALQGIAITGLSVPAGSTGRWQFDAGSGWTDVGAVDASNVLLLRASDSVRFVPDGANGGTATLSYRAWDQTSGSAGAKVAPGAGGGTSAFSTASDTAQPGRHAGQRRPGAGTGQPGAEPHRRERHRQRRQTVASWLGASISDLDTGAAQGIAVTSLASGNGQWQYSLNGGTSWTSMGSPSTGAALLLRASDQVRFVPNAQNGTTASFNYRAGTRPAAAPAARPTPARPAAPAPSAPPATPPRSRWPASTTRPPRARWQHPGGGQRGRRQRPRAHRGQPGARLHHRRGQRRAAGHGHRGRQQRHRRLAVLHRRRQLDGRGQRLGHQRGCCCAPPTSCASCPPRRTPAAPRSATAPGTRAPAPWATASAPPPTAAAPPSAATSARSPSRSRPPTTRRC
jgi:hypothetical protein